MRAAMRALADARDGPFYSLYCALPHANHHPTIGFRISQVADSDDARVVVSVSTEEPGGVGFAWFIAVTATSDEVLVEAMIELDDDGRSSEVFERSARATTADEIVDTIGGLSALVCSQRTWWPSS